MKLKIIKPKDNLTVVTNNVTATSTTSSPEELRRTDLCYQVEQVEQVGKVTKKINA